MKKESYGYLNLFITLLLFSSYEVVSKTLVGKIDPFQINFIRFLIGGVILFALLLFKGDAAISKKDFIGVTITGILIVVLSMNLLQLALYVEGAKASLVTVVYCSNPIFISMVNAIVNKEKIKLSGIIGLSVGFMGIVVVFLDKQSLNLSNYSSLLLSLSAAVVFAFYTVYGRKVTANIGSLKMNAYSFLIGSILLLPVLLINKVNPVVFDYSGIYQVIYLSFVVTGIAYITYFKGLSIVGAISGSLIFFIKPILANIIAVILLNEKLTDNLVIGAGMIILSIFIILYLPVLTQKYKLHRELYKG